MKICLATACFCFSLLSPFPAAWAENSDWKTIGWWDISFYPKAAGCSAFAQFDGGISFFIGLSGNANEISLEVILLNEKWKSVQRDKQYTVNVQFGNEQPWVLDMWGVQDNGFGGLKISEPASSTQAGKFVQEFIREVDMEWEYDGSSLGRLALNDSGAAFAAVVDCTKSYRSAVGQAADPFSSGAPSRSTDPFSN